MKNLVKFPDFILFQQCLAFFSNVVVTMIITMDYTKSISIEIYTDRSSSHVISIPVKTPLKTTKDWHYYAT